jgi:hypothetical protein
VIQKIESEVKQVSDSEERFIELISLCDKSISERAIEAKVVVDEYYSWWTPSNKEVLNLRSLGEDVNTGVIAPYLRCHKLNNKVYITWVTWPRKSLERRLKSDSTYSKQIVPLSRGYTIEQLSRHCQPWEIDKVKETEGKLVLLRESIELLHQTKVNINKMLRKLNKIKPRGNNHE